MLTQDRRVFPHNDYMVTRLSSSERMVHQYQDVHALTSGGFNIDISSYAIAPRSIIGVPVPAGFTIMKLFVLRNYAGVVSDWRSNPQDRNAPFCRISFDD